ncbi:TPA: hypothetical protein ACSTNG_003627 [Serratia fonticola]
MRYIIIIAIFFCCIPSWAVLPGASVGNGRVDLGKVGLSSPVTGGIYLLQGEASFVGYMGEDLPVPAGVSYLSLYVYTEGVWGIFCTASGYDRLCNFPVNSSQTMQYVYDTISMHSPFNFTGLRYSTYSNSLGSDVCAVWVLSATKNAATAAYRVGDANCGVAPPTVSCEISPNDIVLDLGSVRAGQTHGGRIAASILCRGGGANVLLFLQGNAGSDGIKLQGLRDELDAKVTLDGTNSGVGLKINAPQDVPVRFNIEATVPVPNGADGAYQGSAPLIISYL